MRWTYLNKLVNFLTCIYYSKRSNYCQQPFCLKGHCSTLILKWSTEPDLNWRFYGFAIRCIGPLCHLCMNTLVEDRRFELLTEACKATALPITPIPHNRFSFYVLPLHQYVLTKLYPGFEPGPSFLQKDLIRLLKRT